MTTRHRNIDPALDRPVRTPEQQAFVDELHRVGNLTDRERDGEQNHLTYPGTDDPCRYDENGRRLIRVSWDEGVTWNYETTREYLRRRHANGDFDREPSEEEVVEMRAVFGAGTTVVDAITGRETRL